MPCISPRRTLLPNTLPTISLLLTTGLPLIFFKQVSSQHGNAHNNHNRFQQQPPATVEPPFQIDPAFEHEYKELSKRSNSHYIELKSII